MNRFDRAIDALITAYAEGELLSGSCEKCAVGHILTAADVDISPEEPSDEKIYDEENGEYAPFDAKSEMSARWWYYLMAYTHGSETEEDRKEREAMEAACGYSIEELREIEGAFEGGEFTPWEVRTGYAQQKTEIFARLLRVIETLERLEGKEETLMKEHHSSLWAGGHEEEVTP